MFSLTVVTTISFIFHFSSILKFSFFLSFGFEQLMIPWSLLPVHTILQLFCSLCRDSIMVNKDLWYQLHRHFLGFKQFQIINAEIWFVLYFLNKWYFKEKIRRVRKQWDGKSNSFFFIKLGLFSSIYFMHDIKL